MTTELHSPRGQRGFSMFLVIMTMFVTSMFVAAAFAAANGDLPMAGTAKDRKATYAAAEAGLNFYLTHLNQDNDYWTKCENVPAPNGAEDNPVNKVWDGVSQRRWRNVTGSSARYTLEILPANGFAACDQNNQASVLDLATGSFRVRSTGQPTATSSLKRSIVATFRRHGFLDFLYFTYYEDLDPQALSTASARQSAQTNCGEKFRSQRPGSCTEIQFVSGDKINGPLHSNDSLLICGNPTFGRDSADKIEIAAQPGHPPAAARVADDGCSDNSDIKGVWKAGASTLEPPSSNDQLKTVAKAGGSYFQGKTLIHLEGGQMTVRNKNATTTMGLPANGVIYVDADASQGSCQPAQYPVATDYTEDNGCGNVYVSGGYSSSLTISAANDVIIAPTTDTGTLDWAGLDENLSGSNNAVLGLIANNFVRVGHKVKRGSGCSNFSNAMNGKGLEIDAAILSLQHSFITDNYDCGAALGNLNVTGAIAQRYRGAVGTNGGSTGFIKNYVYDDRLRYRSPPFFLNPVDAAWGIVRTNEQVPAR